MKDYKKLRGKLKSQIRCNTPQNVKVRIELILLAHKIRNVREACARRGFSEKTYYKWLNRLERAKYEIWALEDRSRKPLNSPNQTPKWIEEKVKRMSNSSGSVMLSEKLKRSGIKLSVTTICHILNKRRKPSSPKTNKIKAHRKRYELPIPGMRVQMDVKYVPEPVNGRRAFVYVAIDECTRYRYAWCVESINARTTVMFLNRLKTHFPFPIRTIQTDNGQEFTYRFIPFTQTIHPMDEWCERNGIRHRCIPPGEKELNGKVERSHRIDEQNFYWRAPTESIKAFNKSLHQWIGHYNKRRLHGGIGFMTPEEKLSERQKNLENICFINPNLEQMRRKFIAEIPKIKTKTEKLFDQLEAQLKKYNDAA